MTPAFTFDLVGADPGLTAACTEALAGFAEVRQADGAPRPGGGDPDGVLVSIRIPVATGIAAFARSRILRPSIPVIIIGADIDADLAVELVKCGANDFVTRAALRESLRPKLERALNLRNGPVSTLAALDALVAAEPSPSDIANRRRCFRSRPSGASVFLRVPTGEATLTLDELSIPTDGWPGGLGLLADAPNLRRLPLDGWAHGESIALSVRAAGEPVVPITARLVAGSKRQVGADTRLAFQYLPNAPNGDVILRRLWIAGQRKRLT